MKKDDDDDVTLSMSELKEWDWWRVDIDAQGRQILAGLTFEETFEMLTMAVTIAKWKKRYKELTAKHEAVVAVRKSEQGNVLPLKQKGN